MSIDSRISTKNLFSDDELRLITDFCKFWYEIVSIWLIHWRSWLLSLEITSGHIDQMETNQL